MIQYRLIALLMLVTLLPACTVNMPRTTSPVESTPTKIPDIITPTKTLSPTSTVTATIVPSATATETSIPTPTPLPSPTAIGGSGKIILTTMICTSHTVGYPDCESQAVIILSLATGDKQEVAGKGFVFQALSPDGKSILISKDSTLFLKNLSGGELVQISNIFAGNKAGNYGLATWLPDQQHIAFVGRQKTWFDIYMVNLDGTGLKRITEPNSSAYQIFSSTDSKAIYWEKAKGNTTWGYWKTNLDGTEQHHLDNIGRVVFPLSGNLMASAVYPDGLVVSNIDGSNPRNIFSLTPGGFFWQIAISPSGDTLFFNVCPDKTCKPMPYYLASSDGKTTRELKLQFETYNEWWSPDEKKILLVDANADDRPGSTGLDLLDTQTGETESLKSIIGLAKDEYIIRSEIAWIP